MKTLHHLAGIVLLAATAGSWSQPAQAALGGPNGVVIPYAGKLELDGALVSDLVDFEFGVAPAALQPVPTTPVDCRFTLTGIPVTKGEFAVSIVIPVDKESCVKGKDVHLEVRVARAGGTRVLLGKQRVTPVVAAATSGDGDFHVAGALTANTAAVTGALSAGATTVGALTANTAAVTGALSAGTTTVGALSAGATTVTGNLVVTGGVSVGLVTKVCNNVIACDCDAGFVAISGGGTCPGTTRINTSGPFFTGWLVQCGDLTPTSIIIRCARLTP